MHVTPDTHIPPVRAVLFDLDGTLLDIDIDAFMSRYMKALTAHTESIYPEMGIFEAVMAGTEGMMGVHPDETNESAFYRVALERTGRDIRGYWSAFEDFYVEHFDGLRGEAAAAEGAHDALRLSLSLGLRVAVATNPLFPWIAIQKRMGWADLLDHPVDLVTTWDIMEACKPHLSYYRQVADILEVSPGECLMVGDDPTLDMAAADVGMRTFFVGAGEAAGADMTGTLLDLTGVLPDMVDPQS